MRFLSFFLLFSLLLVSLFSHCTLLRATFCPRFENEISPVGEGRAGLSLTAGGGRPTDRNKWSPDVYWSHERKRRTSRECHEGDDSLPSFRRSSRRLSLSLVDRLKASVYEAGEAQTRILKFPVEEVLFLFAFSGCSYPIHPLPPSPTFNRSPISRTLRSRSRVVRDVEGFFTAGVALRCSPRCLKVVREL